MEKTKPSCLLVDDHPLFRAGLKNILVKSHRFSQIKEASNGLEATQIVSKSNIDIVFMDINMPIMNGIEATKIILKERPSTKVIAISMQNNAKQVFEMIKLKVLGYLLKDCSEAEFAKAINRVLDNEVYLCAEIRKMVYENQEHALKNTANTKTPCITDAQKQVLFLLCKEYSTEEIAAELKISALTIKRHRQDLLERTQSKNLAGLVFYALHNNIFPLYNN
jgi:DNA-binding NarL/FixJ family response regulator